MENKDINREIGKSCVASSEDINFHNTKPSKDIKKFKDRTEEEHLNEPFLTTFWCFFKFVVVGDGCWIIGGWFDSIRLF